MATGLAARYWAWPQEWDGTAEFSVFDCPRLWFAKEDLATLPEPDNGILPSPPGVRILMDGSRVECVSEEGRAIWILTGDEDAENYAVLGVWPD